MTAGRDQFLAWGRETLRMESDAISHVANDLLGEGFVSACEAILSQPGRIITTGLGKSGHVARKMASTLASTGSPSHFVHPSEALHGDFGMVNRQDVLVAFAYGGETIEVLQVCKFARRLEIPVIAVTGKPESSLAKVADHLVTATVDREADPNNLAPTSSSTVAMAISDAIAMTVMRARGFGEADFAALHPGGSLGRKLSTVRDHMLTEFSKLDSQDDVHAVLEGITKYNHGIAAVIDDGNKLLGAVSDGDLRRSFLELDEKVFSKKASDLMSSSPKTIGPETFAVEAINIMKNITQLFVVDPEQNHELVGIVRLHDLLAAKII